MANSSAGSKAIPERLYKYKSLEGGSRGHVEQALLEGQIYFSSPDKFNDPFDSRVQLVFPKAPENYREYLLGLLNKFRPNLSPDEQETLVGKILEEKRPESNPDLQRAIVGDLQRHVDSLGVYCLCEHPDDILMWSHYAGGHAGVCLQFENCVGLVDVPKGVPLDVSYSEERPIIEILNDSSRSQAVATLLTKASPWSHEGEWRIVNEGGAGVHQFAPEFLSGVIFGLRTSEENRRTVQEWIAAGPTKPHLYEAHVSPGRFALEIVRLEETVS